MARNPQDAWAVHALAHALYEMAAFDEGVDRLPPAIHRASTSTGSGTISSGTWR